MATRNWAKDSLNDLIEGSGKSMYSQQLRQFVSPSHARHIDPNSAEGQAISKRLTQI